MFNVHQFLFRLDRSYFWPAAGLTPETLNRFDLWQSRSPLTWPSFRPVGPKARREDQVFDFEKNLYYGYNNMLNVSSNIAPLNSSKFLIKPAIMDEEFND